MQRIRHAKGKWLQINGEIKKMSTTGETSSRLPGRTTQVQCLICKGYVMLDQQDNAALLLLRIRSNSVAFLVLTFVIEYISCCKTIFQSKMLNIAVNDCFSLYSRFLQILKAVLMPIT